MPMSQPVSRRVVSLQFVRMPAKAGTATLIAAQVNSRGRARTMRSSTGRLRILRLLAGIALERPHRARDVGRGERAELSGGRHSMTILPRHDVSAEWCIRPIH